MVNPLVGAVVATAAVAFCAGCGGDGKAPGGSQSPKPELPILAWVGVDPNETTVERYRELAEAGFTHSFSWFANADDMAEALDVAKAANVKLLISCPELAKDPEGIANRFKGHPATAGYYLRDEPAVKDFPDLAKWVRRIQAVDAKHICYVNLFPDYASGDQLGAKSYQEYLDQFISQVPVEVISFDYYPVTGGALRESWYRNLQAVADASAKARRPFWAFALSVAHGQYPMPELSHLRLQVYSNLAYGAQCIQYFTYWTVKDTAMSFHDAPISADGRRTAVYALVKEVNDEVAALRGIFAGARVVSVGHTGKLPAGAKEFTPASPITAVKTQGTGAVVSVLANGDKRYLMIVNRDLTRATPLEVTWDNTRPLSRVERNGSLQPLQGMEGNILRSAVEPGDALLLCWTEP